MERAEQLVRDLVAQVPGYEVLLDDHIANYDEVNYILFLLDVVRETVGSYLGEPGADWRATLAFLEGQMAAGDPVVRQAIVNGFVAQLPYKDMPGADIARHLGPELAEAYAVAYANS